MFSDPKGHLPRSHLALSATSPPSPLQGGNLLPPLRSGRVLPVLLGQVYVTAQSQTRALVRQVVFRALHV